MGTNSPKKFEDQEIDLGAISKGIGNTFQGFLSVIYYAIRFFVRKSVIILILFIIGFGIGYYFDRSKVYDHEMIVIPNFDCGDYMYSKVQLLNAKLKERDTVFLNAIGIRKSSELLNIKVSPIEDIYNYVNTNELNFKILELMAEDGDIQKIIKEEATSKNYTYHQITFSTIGMTAEEKTVEPILAYLNDSDYFSKLQYQFVENSKNKIRANDTIIMQIDRILSTKKNSASSLVYNENSQINDLVSSKEKLIRDNGNQRLALLNMDKIVKNNATTLNIKDEGTTSGRMKLFVPFFFIFLFIMIYGFVSFYRSQAIKHGDIRNKK